MGILDGLRGGYEKLEQRGDDALGRARPLDAVRCFEDALRKAGSKDPAAVERLRDKLAGARRAFLDQKISSARELAADDLLADALEALDVARQNLTAGDGPHAERIASLEREYRRRLVLTGGPDRQVDPAQAAAAHLPPDATGQSGGADAPEEGDLAVELPIDGEALEVTFEQFLGALPAEDRERALGASAEFKRAYVARHAGEPGIALEALQRARAAAPEDALVLEHLAQALDEAEQTDEARACYARALELEPRRHGARVALASIASGIRTAGGLQPFAAWRQAIAESSASCDADAGLVLLDEGLRHDPARAGAYVLAAVEILLTAGRTAEALARIERLQSQSVAHAASLHHLRAVALELHGALDEAQAEYDRAVLSGGHALFFRSEFAEFTLRHGRGLAEAEGYIFDTCMSCQASQPGEDELDYYGFLLTRLQFARGELRQALAGIDRLLAKGPPPILEEPLTRLRREVAGAIAAGRQRAEAGDEESETQGEEQDGGKPPEA